MKKKMDAPHLFGLIASPRDEAVIAVRGQVAKALDLAWRRADMLNLLASEELWDDARILCAALAADLREPLARLAEDVGHTENEVARARTLLASVETAVCSTEAFTLAWPGLRLDIRTLFKALYAASCIRRAGTWRTATDRARHRLVLGFCLAMAVLALLAIIGRFGYRTYVREQAFKRENFLVPADFLTPLSLTNMKTAGLGPVEQDKRQRFAWGFGPQTLIAFALGQPRRLRLEYALSTPLSAQRVTVAVNGQVMAEHDFPVAHPQDAAYRFTLTFNGKAGLNSITFAYADWNGHFRTFANDGRPLAMRFTRLRLLAESTGPS